MNRLAKQSMIAGIFLIIVSVLGWLLYRVVVPAPTCSDGIQNGAEEGVDCGVSACTNLCVSPVLPIVVSTPLLLSAGAGSDVLVELQNKNPLYGASVVPYTLTAFDASGAMLTTRRGVEYVNPGVSRYILFPLGAQSKSPARAELSLDLSAITWATLTQDVKGDVQFGVRNESLNVTSDEVRYSASVLNKSKFAFDTVDVMVLLVDKNNTIVSANSTVQRTLLPGEERAFVMTWPFAVADAVRAQVIVTTNIFANGNFIRAYGSQTPTQGF